MTCRSIAIRVWCIVPSKGKMNKSGVNTFRTGCRVSLEMFIVASLGFEHLGRTVNTNQMDKHIESKNDNK